MKSIVRSFPKLTSLSMLGLTGCTDFRPLAELASLASLSLPSDRRRSSGSDAQSTHVSDDRINGGYYDFSYLSCMTRMETLYLPAVPLYDLSVLRNMKRLRRLDVAFSNVSDVSVLAGLHHITFRSSTFEGRVSVMSRVCGATNR